jgi:hypothetical protein
MRLNIINYKISGPLWVENTEYSITTPNQQAENAYIWDIHKLSEGEPPYLIGHAWLWKEIGDLLIPSYKISIINTENIVVHNKWLSKGLLSTNEHIIDTIKGSIRLREIE